MRGRVLIWLTLLLFASAACAEERDVILVLDNAATMKRVDAEELTSSAVGGFIEKLKGGSALDLEIMLLHKYAKFISIYKQSNHNIMHPNCFGKAKGFASQSFNTSA